MASRRSLAAGIITLWTIGCFYGIVRANLLDGYTHFMFDCGVLGLYAVHFTRESTPKLNAVSRTAKFWLILLIGWPVILFVLPVNHYLVQLVGLRHIVIFLPALLLGSRLRAKDLDQITTAIAVLNVVAFGFAIAQYIYGIAPFFPRNAVTAVMYGSFDVTSESGRFHRIPSIFMSSHGYGGVMALTLPFFINSIFDETGSLTRRVVMGAICALTVVAMFMAGPRLPIVSLGFALFLMLVLPGLSTQSRGALLACFLAIGLIASYFVISDSRLQRIASLSNTEMVKNRASGITVFEFVDCFTRYPLGVGLGGVVGSTLPYFLRDLAPSEYFGAEDEYARIAAEQGIIGFTIWVTFLIRLAMRQPVPVRARWLTGTHAMRAIVIAVWATCFIGTGILQGIPYSFLLLLQMGVLLREPVSDALPGVAPPKSPINPSGKVETRLALRSPML